MDRLDLDSVSPNMASRSSYTSARLNSHDVECTPGGDTPEVSSTNVSFPSSMPASTATSSVFHYSSSTPTSAVASSSFPSSNTTVLGYTSSELRNSELTRALAGATEETHRNESDIQAFREADNKARKEHAALLDALAIELETLQTVHGENTKVATFLPTLEKSLAAIAETFASDPSSKSEAVNNSNKVALINLLETVRNLSQECNTVTEKDQLAARQVEALSEEVGSLTTQVSNLQQDKEEAEVLIQQLSSQSESLSAELERLKIHSRVAPQDDDKFRAFEAETTARLHELELKRQELEKVAYSVTRESPLAEADCAPEVHLISILARLTPSMEVGSVLSINPSRPHPHSVRSYEVPLMYDDIHLGESISFHCIFTKQLTRESALALAQKLGIGSTIGCVSFIGCRFLGNSMTLEFQKISSTKAIEFLDSKNRLSLPSTSDN